MKQKLQMMTLFFLLLWTLAWIAAGRGVTPPQEPADSGETTEREPARGTPDRDIPIRVLRGGTIEPMTMDEYLLGVLRAEMPAGFELEALKAQAIAARTYTLYKMRGGPIANHPDADTCDNINCCKAYKTADEAAADWGGMALYYEEKLARAVRETDGWAALYDDAPILAVFFSSSNGHTQNAGAVWQSDLPYLRSVESPEDGDLVPNYYSVVSFTPEEFKRLILASRPEAVFTDGPETWITDIARNEAGFVTSVSIGGVRLRGNELRAMLSLRSPSFTVETNADSLVFRVTGYGHGVGMSQYGANAMALQGLEAREILEHYFTGASVGPVSIPTPQPGEKLPDASSEL